MAITHKQSTGIANTGNNNPASKAIVPNAVGNILLVAGGASSNNPLAISDTAVNTWNVLVAQFNNGTSTFAAWWAAANGTSSTTISVSATGGAGNFTNMFVTEFALGGAATVSQIDQTNHTTGAVTLTTAGNLAADNEAVWLACNDTVTAVGTINGSTATLGFNDGAQDFSEWLILSGGSGATATGTFTGTASGAAIVIATIKPITSASHFLGCLGAGG